MPQPIDHTSIKGSHEGHMILYVCYSHLEANGINAESCQCILIRLSLAYPLTNGQTMEVVKATFSFHKIITQKTQMPTLYTN